MWWQILAVVGGFSATLVIAVATVIYVCYTQKLWQETKTTAELTKESIEQTKQSLDLNIHTSLLNLSLFCKKTFENAAQQKRKLSAEQQSQALAWHTLALAYFDMSLEYLSSKIDLSMHPELTKRLEKLLETSEQMGVELSSNKLAEELKKKVKEASKKLDSKRKS